MIVKQQQSFCELYIKTLYKNLLPVVYPAETPENIQFQSASENDSDMTSSLELSLDDTMCDLDATITNDLIMREEDEELFGILNELGMYDLLIFTSIRFCIIYLLGDVSNELEDDSVLSQMVKIDEEEPDLDLTLPLPKSPEKTELDEYDFDKTLIPQLDGEFDDENLKVS